MTNESWRMKYCAAPSNGMAVGRILIQLGGAQGKGVIWRGADVVAAGQRQQYRATFARFV